MTLLYFEFAEDPIHHPHHKNTEMRVLSETVTWIRLVHQVSFAPGICIWRGVSYGEGAS